MRELWPPLSLIEERTRTTPALAIASTPALESHDDAAPSPVPPMPDIVVRTIDRGTEIRDRKIEQLSPGTVVLIDVRLGEDGVVRQRIAHPFAFCLDRRLGGNTHAERWAGWMTAPETDYAGPYDVLLEPSEDPFDPHAGMVQTWNPLVLGVQRPARLLANLSPERLAVVRAVADESATGAGNVSPASPGRVELRPVGARNSALTGTQLGAADDSRLRYQALYRDLAKSFMPQAANEESWFGSHRKQFYAIAATVIGAIGTALLVQHTPDEAVQIAKFESAPVRPPLPPIPPPAQPSAGPAGDAGDVTKTAPAPTPAPPDSPAPSSQPTQLAKAAPATAPTPKSAPRPATEPVQVAKAPESTPTDTSRPQQLIMLASLDEARFAVRAIQRLDFLATHVLRVVDRDSVPKALELLRTMQISAAEAKSPTPAVILSLPRDANVAQLEERLSGSGLFMPRALWVKPPSSAAE